MRFSHFRRRPGWTFLVVGTLTLGIGANTAIFSVANAVLLKPLPFASPDELVYVSTTNQRRDVARALAPYDDVADWRHSGAAFRSLSTYQQTELTLKSHDDAVRVVGVRADHRLFDLLGVTPTLGRGIQESDEQRGAGRSVVLSHQFWRQHFGESESAIGQPLYIEGERHEVVGVMPASFVFPDASGLAATPSVWLPLSRPDPRMARQGRVYTVIGRLRGRHSLNEAEAQLRAVAQRLERAYPRTHDGWSVRLIPVANAIAENSRGTLLLLLGAVGAILLMACANAAMLLLVRGVGRLDEFDTRLALGASHRHLFFEVMGESAVIGLAAGAGGIAVGVWTSQVLRHLLSSTLPRATEVGLDWRVGVFGLGLTGLSILICGAVPALMAAAHRTSHRARSSADGRGIRRWQRSFVIAEVAVATMLLVAAATLTRSLIDLQQTDLGFNSRQVLSFEMHLPAATYREPARVRATQSQVLDSLASAPGVVAAGGINILPPAALNLSFTFSLDGDGGLEDQLDARRTNFRVVTPNYFHAIEVPIIRGRDIGAQDGAENAPVAVVNERFAKRYFGDVDPIGRSITLNYGMSSPIARQIVGIVGDVRQAGPHQEPSPEVYIPYSQEPFRWMSVAVRVNGDPRAFAAPLTALVRKTDDLIAIDHVAGLAERVAASVGESRLRMTAFAALAALALLLAMSGVFGVTAFATRRRMPELAVRVALGAPRRSVVRLVAGEYLLLACSGAAAGIIAAALLGRTVETLIGVVISPDVSVAVVGGVASVVASLAATWHPTARAVAVDPAHTLRPS